MSPLGIWELGAVLLVALGAGWIAYRGMGDIERRIAFAPSGSRWAIFLSRRMNGVADGMFVLVTLIFFAIFLFLCLRRYATGSFFGDDFAFFNQAIWNSMHGRLFEDTAYLDSTTILGHHFSPILLALVPLYVVSDGALVLAVLPAAAMALTAFPLYWFARQQIGRRLALVIVCAFFLSPSVQYLGTGQFYEIMLATPLLMLGLMFLLRYRYLPFLVCLVLALLVKETVSVVAIGIGGYIAIVQRKVIPGLTLALMSLACALGLLLIVIPFFQGGTNFYFFGGSAERPGQNLYGYLGKDLTEIVTTALTRPDRVLPYLLVKPKVEAVLYLLLPLGLVPLAGLEVTALALFALGYILLTDAPWVYSLWSYHYAAVVPFIFAGFVVGARRIVDWFTAHPKRIVQVQSRDSRRSAQAAVGAFILTASVLSSGIYNSRQPVAILDPERFPVEARDATRAVVARMIPLRAVVLAQTELLPLVSQRKHAYIMPAIPCVGMTDYLFADTHEPWYTHRREVWTEMLRLPFFETVWDRDGIILKQRALPINSLEVNWSDQIGLLGYTLNTTSTLMGGYSFRPVLTWRIKREMEERYFRSVQVLDSQGHTWAIDDGTPANGDCATNRLDAGTLLSDLLRLELPPTMPAGDYSLMVGLYNKADGQFLQAERQNAPQGELVTLVTLRVAKNKSDFTASDLQKRFQLDNLFFVDMQEIRLIGFKSLPQTTRGGNTLPVGIYWRAREKPRGDYVVNLQLRDATGRATFEQASRPANGTYPTTEWSEGEVLLDWHDLIVPTALAPGDYTVQVVLRDAGNDRVLGETALAKISVVGR